MSDALLNDEVLPKLARAGDRDADEVVERVVASFELPSADPNWEERRGAYPRLMQEIGRDDDDALVKAFLRGGGEIDAKIQAKIVHRAQAFFEEHGVAVITALFLASLPHAYLGRRGVQALDMTGELVANWSRRIQETGQFLVNVLTRDPAMAERDRTTLHHGESGARVVRRVRLTHSAVRWLLKAPYDPKLTLLSREELADPKTLWHLRMSQIDERVGDDLSEPLNQEDMLATLGTFTTVVFGALGKLAVPFDKEEQEAFYHLWNIVGWHLGIGDERALADVDIGLPDRDWPHNKILPLDVNEMDRVFGHLRPRLERASEQGRRLAKTLVQDFSYPLPRPIQGGPAFVVRYLIGDGPADMLEIGGGGYASLVARRSRALERLAERTRTSVLGRHTLAAVAQMLTRYALRNFVARSRESERGLTIEPHMASRWGVETGPELLIHESPARL
ncbi:MAG TPA: oxygenase MpaB family protein [Nocardioidaceae bacterium]|nr:oxygenase MpaB family protein [Nocardioidaceae bacterium]